MINRKQNMEKKRKDIVRIKQEILLRKKKLIEIEANDVLKQRLKRSKEFLIDLEKELFDVEQSLRFEQVEELKEILTQKNINKEISEQEYDDNIRDINKLSKVLKQLDNLEVETYNFKLFQNNAIVNEDITIEYSERRQEQFNSVEQEFQGEMSSFMRTFSLHQKIRGNISKEQRKAILEQEKFGKSDLEQVIEELYEVIDSRSPIKDNFEMSMELAKKTLPKSDIENITFIDDYITKQQLCELYQVQNSDDIEIYAIQNYNNATIGEISGVKREFFKESDGVNYDTKMGEQIGLYCFNKKTGKLELMQNGTIPKVISTGSKIEVYNLNETKIQDEIATISYSGLNLSFYTNENGKLCVARKDNSRLTRGLKEIDTQTLDDMENRRESKEKINKIINSEQKKNELETVEINFDNIYNAEELRKKTSEMDTKDFFERVRENVRKYSKTTNLQSKEEAQKHEKSDREKLDTRRRLM